LTEVDVYNSALKELEAVSAIMSSVFGESNFDRAYQAHNCIDGFYSGDTCRTAANDSNPWILIDYGDKALDDVMVIRVSATIESGDPLRDYAIYAIQGARVAVTTDNTGDEVVWSSTISGLNRRVVFENEQDSGVTLAKLHKENECKALSKFCSDDDRYWPDTPSFEYFGGSEVTPATCDFALAKCHEDVGDYAEARLHYIKAGGLAVGSGGSIETGAKTYTDRLAEAAAALGALYVKAPNLPTFRFDATSTDSARRWYAQALVLGWEPPKPRCIWGHRLGFAENGTEVDISGPASWNGQCHSRWDTCDPMNAAILNRVYFSDAVRAFNSPLFPAGSVCTAVCLGTVDNAETYSLRSDFTCGDDGVWKGELLCPDTFAAANPGQAGSDVGETSPRSTWRATGDNLSTLQRRWLLSAVPLHPAASAVTKVKCEWVDTQAIRGTHVWVTFGPPASTFNSDGDELDMNFDIEHALVVKVYSTVYADTKSIVEYNEL
jgi:hypothetical protein